MGTALERLSTLGDDSADDPLSGLRQLAQPKPLLTPAPSEDVSPSSSSSAGTLPPFARTVADQTYQGPPRPNPQARKLTGPARILTQYLAQPMVDNPVQTVATSLLPLPLALPGIAHMGKDIAQYVGQKAAELSLPPHERALAEADPNRIPGERAAVEATMLAAPLAIHAGITGYKNLTDYGPAVSQGIREGAQEGSQMMGPSESAQEGLPPRGPDMGPRTTPLPLSDARNAALVRAEAIASHPGPSSPLAALQQIAEGPESQPGLKFTEGRAAAALPPEPARVIAPEEATAQPSQLVQPESPATPGRLVAPTPAPQPTPGPLLDRFGVPIEESPNTPTGAYDARGIGRRPVNELPVNQRPPVEPPPDAVTQSFGGVVGRRPGGQIVTPEPAPSAPEIPPAILNRLGQEPPPVEPPPEAQTASFGGESQHTLQPIISSNGQLDARPGILRQVNAELGPDELGSGATPTPASLADQPDVTGTRSFVAKEVTPGAETPGTPEPRPSDILNVAKLNLDKSAEQRVAEQLEQFRSMRETQQQTFADADINRKAIVNELTAGNPKALLPAEAAKLSGEELLARRDVVNQNDQMIGSLSKAIASGEMTPAEQEAATQLMQKAVEHNDALLQDLVTGSSQKGRDLNLLRRMANTDLDPATWLVQAKRMLGDQPLTDAMMSDIRRLVQAAVEACG